MSTTLQMNDALRAEMIRLGWNPEKALWGRRVSGSPGHVCLELPDGTKTTYLAPLTTVRGGDQVAIVRWG